jgi:hypothetical protein
MATHTPRRRRASLSPSGHHQPGCKPVHQTCPQVTNTTRHSVPSQCHRPSSPPAHLTNEIHSLRRPGGHHTHTLTRTYPHMLCRPGGNHHHHHQKQHRKCPTPPPPTTTVTPSTVLLPCALFFTHHYTSGARTALMRPHRCSPARARDSLSSQRRTRSSVSLTPN